MINKINEFMLSAFVGLVTIILFGVLGIIALLSLSGFIWSVHLLWSVVMLLL